MPLFTANGQHIFFAHVPKTGGSSIEDYLFRRLGSFSLHERLRPKPGQENFQNQRGIFQAAQHLAAADLKVILPPDLAYSFAVVRDPLQRMISEFRFQSGVSMVSHFGFSTWLRIVLKAAKRDRRIYENHIRPQSDLVPEGAQVFRFEDGFDPVITWLDDITGSTAPEIEMGHFLNRKKKPVSVLREDVRLIREFYAEDYQRFFYPYPDADAYAADNFSGLRSVPAGLLARHVVAGQHRRWLR